ncbi:MAG: hypothetical protein HMLIMOIP_001689 [Candidatus Nitrosomirales archaeon]
MVEFFTSKGQFGEEPERKATLRGIPSKLGSAIELAGSTSVEAIKQRVREKLAREQALKEAKNAGRLRVLLTTGRTPEEIEKSERKKRTRIVIAPQTNVTQRVSQETDVDVRPSILPEPNLSLFGDSGKGLSLLGSSSPSPTIVLVKERAKSSSVKLKDTPVKDELRHFLYGSPHVGMELKQVVKQSKAGVKQHDHLAELGAFTLGSKAGKKVRGKQPRIGLVNDVNDMLFGNKKPDLLKFLGL